jgi:hypothetical protein
MEGPGAGEAGEAGQVVRGVHVIGAAGVRTFDQCDEILVGAQERASPHVTDG